MNIFILGKVLAWTWMGLCIGWSLQLAAATSGTRRWGGPAHRREALAAALAMVAPAVVASQFLGGMGLRREGVSDALWLVTVFATIGAGMLARRQMKGSGRRPGARNVPAVVKTHP